MGAIAPQTPENTMLLLMAQERKLCKTRVLEGSRMEFGGEGGAHIGYATMTSHLSFSYIFERCVGAQRIEFVSSKTLVES